MTSTVLYPIMDNSISIHILHAEDDFVRQLFVLSEQIFQSTSSMRRMTVGKMIDEKKLIISIHILHAEDDVVSLLTSVAGLPISIHILHAEDDRTK